MTNIGFGVQINYGMVNRLGGSGDFVSSDSVYSHNYPKPSVGS